MSKPSSYQKLKAKNQELELKCEKLEAEKQELKDKVGELEGEVRDLKSQFSRLNHNSERMCDLLLEQMDTQKFIYYKGDDNNSVGKLVGIGSKREGHTSTLYPYVVE